jgi:RHS repeat-associated protein
LERKTKFDYDFLNRVTQITDAKNQITGFTYDANGNLLTVTDANSNTTTYTYDVQDRLDTRTDSLNRQESYTYDLYGNLKTFTDRKLQVSTFTYDALDRRTLSQYDDGSTTSFTYDTAGRLTAAEDSTSGRIEFSYDNIDRLAQELTPQGTVGYQYDAIGRRTTMTVNGQTPVTYQHDSNSRLTQVAQGTQVVGVGYDAAGRRTGLTYPNGVNTTYTYDTASRLTNILHQGPSSIIEDLTYTYDAAGNRVSLTRSSGASTVLPGPVQAAYDAANEQIQFNNPTPNLTYDANGNLTSQTDANGTTNYTWDARNRLVGISGPGVSASFVYDALGRRITKTINGVTTDIQYDGNDIVQEIGGAAVSATYIRSLNIDEPFLRASAVAEYYHTDALGSTLALTDQTGSVQTTYTYDPFGNTTISGVSNNPFQYTGRENDGTGIYYYRARYHSPTSQRFLSEDPSLAPYTPLSVGACRKTNKTIWLLPSKIKLLGVERGQDLNSYIYVLDNPLRFTDPSGLVPVPCNYLTQAEKCRTITRNTPVGPCVGTTYNLLGLLDCGRKPSKQCLTNAVIAGIAECLPDGPLPVECTREMLDCIENDPNLP